MWHRCLGSTSNPPKAPALPAPSWPRLPVWVVICAVLADTAVSFLPPAPNALVLQKLAARAAPCPCPSPPLPSAFRSQQVSGGLLTSPMLDDCLLAACSSAFVARGWLTGWQACLACTCGGGGGDGGVSPASSSSPHPVPKAPTLLLPCSGRRTEAVFCWQCGACHAGGCSQLAQGPAKQQQQQRGRCSCRRRCRAQRNRAASCSGD